MSRGAESTGPAPSGDRVTELDRPRGMRIGSPSSTVMVPASYTGSAVRAQPEVSGSTARLATGPSDRQGRRPASAVSRPRVPKRHPGTPGLQSEAPSRRPSFRHRRPGNHHMRTSRSEHARGSELQGRAPLHDPLPPRISPPTWLIVPFPRWPTARPIGAARARTRTEGWPHSTDRERHPSRP